jgi:hypothetical protein
MRSQMVHGALAACGLLKFFECPLLRAQEYLLQFLISMWSPELQCFIVHGEHLAFSAEEDVYFLTGLPFRGTLLSGRAGGSWRGAVGYPCPDILFGRGFYVWVSGEDWGDGCPGTSLHGSDGCESVWVTRDSAYQWWPAEDHAAGTRG